jgi:hypothetical protein
MRPLCTTTKSTPYTPGKSPILELLEEIHTVKISYICGVGGGAVVNLSGAQLHLIETLMLQRMFLRSLLWI